MEIEMVVISCVSCKGVFAIPAAVDGRLRDTHESFFCPLGHSQCYPALTDLDRANREVKRLKGIVQDQGKVLAEQRKALAKSKRKAGDSKRGTTKT